MEPVVPKLLVYGPLGIFCVILLYTVIALYRAKEKAAKDATDRFDAMVAKNQADMLLLIGTHKDEMTALVQRHISKSETWVEKGNELATNLHAVLDSIVKRRD